MKYILILVSFFSQISSAERAGEYEISPEHVFDVAIAPCTDHTDPNICDALIRKLEALRMEYEEKTEEINGLENYYQCADYFDNSDAIRKCANTINTLRRMGGTILFYVPALRDLILYLTDLPSGSSPIDE